MPRSGRREEGAPVVEPHGGLSFPPLAVNPVAEGDVGLLVAESGEFHVFFVTDGTGIVLVAVLVILVRVFGVDGAIGIACTDKEPQSFEQKVEVLRKLCVHPQLPLMGLVEAGLSHLGHGIGIAIGLITTPKTC